MPIALVLFLMVFSTSTPSYAQDRSVFSDYSTKSLSSSIASEIKIIDEVIQQSPELCCLSEDEVDMALSDGGISRLLAIFMPQRFHLICPALRARRMVIC